MEMDTNMLQAVEAFGHEAIRLFYEKGVALKLFNGAEYDIIMDAINQDAEKQMIDKIQSHFDEHFEKKEDCPDLEELEKAFNLEVNIEGRTIVTGYKKRDTKGMN